MNIKYWDKLEDCQDYIIIAFKSRSQEGILYKIEGNG